jgi:hypothetical protein
MLGQTKRRTIDMRYLAALAAAAILFAAPVTANAYCNGHRCYRPAYFHGGGGHFGGGHFGGGHFAGGHFRGGHFGGGHFGHPGHFVPPGHFGHGWGGHGGGWHGGWHGGRFIGGRWIYPGYQAGLCFNVLLNAWVPCGY